MVAGCKVELEKVFEKLLVAYSMVCTRIKDQFNGNWNDEDTCLNTMILIFWNSSGG